LGGTTGRPLVGVWTRSASMGSSRPSGISGGTNRHRPCLRSRGDSGYILFAQTCCLVRISEGCSRRSWARSCGKSPFRNLLTEVVGERSSGKCRVQEIRAYAGGSVMTVRTVFLAIVLACGGIGGTGLAAAPAPAGARVLSTPSAPGSTGLCDPKARILLPRAPPMSRRANLLLPQVVAGHSAIVLATKMEVEFPIGYGG
jgi:hypothetical protein